MDTILAQIADRYAKKTAKSQMRKISKIFYKAVKQGFKDGWLACESMDGTASFCRDECKMYNTEYRCKECSRSEFE